MKKRNIYTLILRVSGYPHSQKLYLQTICHHFHQFSSDKLIPRYKWQKWIGFLEDIAFQKEFVECGWIFEERNWQKFSLYQIWVWFLWDLFSATSQLQSSSLPGLHIPVWAKILTHRWWVESCSAGIARGPDPSCFLKLFHPLASSLLLGYKFCFPCCLKCREWSLSFNMIVLIILQ